MAESVVSVCWKNHTSELATVYKSLLENNFLVDCTVSAEGQNLKAHRLVLSACSPYFHKLFRDETGKHPFIIFLDASFETLKAVIDFVYQGETHIPERNLKAFLTLAQSLQIKGLNAFTEDYRSKTVTSNSIGNVPQDSSEDNQFFTEVESVSAIKDSPENCPQQFPHHLGDFPDPEHANSSVPFEEYGPSPEETRIPQGHRRCDEVTTDNEITVKDELLDAISSEERNEQLDNSRSENPIAGNFSREVNERTASTYGCGVPPDANVELSVLPPSQQQPMEVSEDIPFGQDVEEPLLPAMLVPKSEHPEEGESGGGVDCPLMPGNDTDATPDQSFTAAEAGAGAGAGGVFRCEGCGAAFAQAHHLAAHLRAHRAGPPPFTCAACGKAFPKKNNLVLHLRTHSGEKPFACARCGRRFALAHHLAEHARTHTGERPLRCEHCGRGFACGSSLARHRYVHSGERPFACDVCGKLFTRPACVTRHKRIHALPQAQPPPPP